MKNEGGVKKDIMEWLRAHHVYDIKTIRNADTVLGFFHMPVQTGYGLSGVPDFDIVFMGRAVVVETKSESKPAKPTALQQRFIDSVIKAGGVGFCANSLDMFVLKWVTLVDTKHYLRHPNEKVTIGG